MTTLGKSKRQATWSMRSATCLVASGERHFKRGGFTTYILKHPGNFQRDMGLHYGGGPEEGPRAL